MTLSHYRRDRRNLTRRETTQQLIVFRIRRDWFALPIRAAYRVIPLGQVYGIQGDVSLTRYQDRDVSIIDIQRRIFGDGQKPIDRPSLPTSSSTAASHITSQNTASIERTGQHHLLLLQSAEGELIGIPLNEFPSLRRVPESAFTPVPQTYLAEGGIRCVSALITSPQNEAPIFLLNLNQLIDSQVNLPLIKDK
ncbi:chemotaxis protein CheW [Thermocoleostomius sinensis]|uniref:Chemotaxis protein CheW n=1 Tax=Thermocoleostomius sinensis A174 TaxID=2016057 RepID=A0A9E8ZEP1_9CYAN|nr:chemotaxis protein CheW [Thermocoleostomius sinensis]WAL60464.1 chemotaxis protein CheW [Thermocoleostomius sinensis A174]